MHGPGNTEVQDDAAFQAHEGRGEIVHGEALGVLFRGVEPVGSGVLGVGAEEVALVAGDGQGLGIADGVKHHVQRIAADVAQGADAAGGLLDEGAVGDAATAAAAGLDVIDVAQHAGLHDLLDHLHVLIAAGLEADGEDLAALLLGAHHFNGLVDGDGEGLLQQHVDAVLQGVDGGNGVGGVVGANGNAVQVLFVVDHFLVAGIEAYAFHAEALHESFRLAGNQVCGRDDFHVGHVFIALNVALSDPAGADDTNLQLAGSVYLLFANFLHELAKNLIGIRHSNNLHDRICVYYTTPC